jgi:hypothetical protein
MDWLPLAASFLCWIGLFVSSAQLADWRGLRLPIAGWLTASLFLWLLSPGLDRHLYLGHEAEYLRYFTGEYALGPGDTLRYPGMQLWWWAWGMLLPGNEALPLLIGIGTGALASVLFACWLARTLPMPVPLLASLWLLSHPLVIAWSSSAYNLVYPFALGIAGLFAADRSTCRPGRNWPLLSVFSLALAVGMRADSLLFLPLCVFVVCAAGGSPRARVQQWLLPIAVLACTLGMTLLPLISSIPGGGERLESLRLNIWMWDYYAPYSSLPGVLLLGLAAILSFRAMPKRTGALLAAVLLNHLIMSSFNDFGSRHTFVAIAGMGGMLAFASKSLGRWIWPLWILSVALNASGAIELRERYYADAEGMAATLGEEPWASLPRVSLASAQSEGCAWVSEADPVAADPVRSHFNLLSEEEELQLRRKYGCIDWCWDLEDWRWTSLAVRDRALRLSRIYELHPAAVIEQGGYTCVQMRVGERRQGITSRSNPF